MLLYLSWAYGAMMRGNSVNVDDYTRTTASFKDRVVVAFVHWCVYATVRVLDVFQCVSCVSMRALCMYVRVGECTCVLYVYVYACI